MKRSIRWELLIIDTLIYLISALLIFVMYPSAINHLTWTQVFLYSLIGWVCITGSRMVFHIYRKIWRYAGPMEYISLILADLVATGLIILLRELLVKEVTFMRAFSLVALNLLGCVIIRLVYQYAYQNRSKDLKHEKIMLGLLHLTGTSFADEKVNTNRIKIAIVGAGSVGTMLAEELIQNPKATYEPVCFVDVDKQKAGREVYNLPVLNSTDDLHNRLQGYGVQEVVFAIPNIPPDRREELYRTYREMGYKIKAYDAPQFGEKGRLHDFSIEDLLFRAPADFLTSETRAYYRGKNVLITGGGGSIGSELARQIAKCEPSRLVLLDVYENGAYDVQQELKRKHPDLNLRVEIASICDKDGLEKIFSDHTPDIVLHAAAHKHVPLMERNCIEAVRNNVFGTKNVVDCCEKFFGTKNVVDCCEKFVVYKFRSMKKAFDFAQYGIRITQIGTIVASIKHQFHGFFLSDRLIAAP